MAQSYTFLRTPVVGRVPTLAQLALGQLAINLADGKLFLRQGTGISTDVLLDVAHPGVAQLPASVQTNLNVASVSGVLTASMVLWTIPIVQPCTVPANFAGALGYARTAGTGGTALTLSYLRSGTKTPIGTLTFAAADHALTLSFQPALALLAGDVLLLDGPATPDAALADFGITLPTIKA